MWHSSEAGQTPDVSFLKLAGIALIVLTLAAGSISLIGLTLAEPEQVVAQRAVQLEQEAEALFRQVDAANAARHDAIQEFVNREGVQQ